jgi:cysteinyl-tRNA synthetase
MLEMVKEIMDHGYAYETSTGIYFDVSKLDKYPVLSNNDVSGQEAGARIEVDPEKRNPYDFALWIKAPENHIMKWDSFFGKSYPGWHLECSAMSYKYLGENFDIHTGGIDHIPIHHENEIAQAMGFCGEIPANYWIHVNFLTVDGNKMSKSLNNLYTIDELEKMGYEPLVYRMFNFSSSYRAQINFTFEAMDSAKIALDRLREGYLKHANGTENVSDEEINNLEEQFHKAINDDLNMPVAMSVVWNVIKNPIKSQKFKDLLLKFDQVLGFDLKNYTGKEQKEIPQEDLELVELRNQARKNKDWKESDRIRDILLSKGYSVKDTPEGTQIS